MLKYTDGVTGLLTVIYGPMRSAKSGELIKLCSDLEHYQGKNVIIFKPEIDQRFSNDEVCSRIGTKLHATNIPVDLSTIKTEIYEHGTISGQNLIDKDVVAFDEAQFYTDELVDIVSFLLKHKKDVIIAGLNLDYTGHPIGSMGRLLLMADEPIQKNAYCCKCGRPALFTQKLNNGVPVTHIDETNMEIGESQYEPRCRHCFVTEN